MSRPSYTRDEERAVQEEWRTRSRAVCPRCRRELLARAIPRPAAVSYVRSRSWLTCPACHRAVVADDARERT